MSSQIENYNEIITIRDEINQEVINLNKKLVKMQNLGVNTFCKQKDSFESNTQKSCLILEVKMDISI